jgi:rhodanese-related sulfurtransferase
MIKKISPKKAKKMMNEDVIVLDVRSPMEFSMGHVENAVLLPVGAIGNKVENIIEDKQQTILVYCASGSRSHMAAQILNAMGYENIYDFGGIMSWQYELVS